MLDTESQSLSKGDDIAIAARAMLVRNDEKILPRPTGEGRGEGVTFAKQTVTTLVPQYLNALVPSKRVAFTLAEVLITLGIIGVVAAITMPTLIQNHKNQETVARLQKAISVLNNGMRKMMADEGVELMDYLELNACNPIVISHDGSTQSCLKPYFSKYFNILKDNAGLSSSSTEFYPYKDVKKLNGGNNQLIGMLGVTCYYCFITSDSIMYCPYSFSFGGGYSGLVDINGSKGPNQIGRDIFMLERKENGTYVPRGGDTWDDPSNNDYCDPESGFGYGCAARIVQDGWKIKY